MKEGIGLKRSRKLYTAMVGSAPHRTSRHIIYQEYSKLFFGMRTSCLLVFPRAIAPGGHMKIFACATPDRAPAEDTGMLNVNTSYSLQM